MKRLTKSLHSCISPFCAILIYGGLALLPLSARGDWQWANEMAEPEVTSDSYRAAFTFHNSGKEKLKVDVVNAACSCTVFSFDSEEAEPGKDGILTITINRAKSSSTKRSFSFLVGSEGATPANLSVVLKEE